MEPSANGGARAHDMPRPDARQLLIGPEGGWTDEEAGAARALRSHAGDAGRATLRADIVPLVALTAVCECWNAW